MYVKDIVFYGEETASVVVASSEQSVEVFCHLCEYSVGDKVQEPLRVLDADIQFAYAFDAPDRVRKQYSKEWIKKTGEYSYEGCGKVVDSDEGVVSVNGIQINLGSDLYEGYVNFSIERLDLR